MSKVSTRMLIDKLPLKEEVSRVDIIVAFLKYSGLRSLYPWLHYWKDNHIPVRIITSTYLSLTEPAALYELNYFFPDNVRIYNGAAPTFHPKAYFFHMNQANQSHIFVGSSNLSQPGLCEGVEWNYRIDYAADQKSFLELTHEFERIFNHHCKVADQDVIDGYSKQFKENAHIRKIMNEHYLSLMADHGEHHTKVLVPNSAQLETLFKLKQTRADGYQKALVVLATGVGKTFLSAVDSYDFKGKKILYVAHRKEILSQAENTFKTIHTHKSTSLYVDGIRDLSGDIVFASVYALTAISQHFKPNYFDYIIVDEVHHATARSYATLFAYFQPQFMLGITATPYRLDGQDVLQLFDYNVVNEVNLFEAINRDLLVPMDYRGIYDGTVNYELVAMKGKYYESESLSLALMTKQRADLVLMHYRRFNVKKTVGFCSSLKHAEYMATYFNENGIRAVVVGSNRELVHYYDRKAAIEDFHSNASDEAVKVIFTVDMLSEGVDIPAIDSILLLRPTESLVVFVQQIGRGLRRHRDKQKCLILDFIGNYKRLDLIPALFATKKVTKHRSSSEMLHNIAVPLLSNIEFEFEVLNIMDAFLKSKLKQNEFHQNLVIETYKTYRKNQPLSRVEYFTQLSMLEYQNIKSHPESNPFKNFIKFLKHIEANYQSDLTLEQLEFINEIETTSMTRLYKIPVLSTLVSANKLVRAVELTTIQQSFHAFYQDEMNMIDVLHQKNRNDVINVGANQQKIIISNPIKYLVEKSRFLSYDTEARRLHLHLDTNSHNEAELIHHIVDVLQFKKMEYQVMRLSHKT